jgi:hypothetical protein
MNDCDFNDKYDCVNEKKIFKKKDIFYLCVTAVETFYYRNKTFFLQFWYLLFFSSNVINTKKNVIIKILNIESSIATLI